MATSWCLFRTITIHRKWRKFGHMMSPYNNPIKVSMPTYMIGTDLFIWNGLLLLWQRHDFVRNSNLVISNVLTSYVVWSVDEHTRARGHSVFFLSEGASCHLTRNMPVLWSPPLPAPHRCARLFYVPYQKPTSSWRQPSTMFHRIVRLSPSSPHDPIPLRKWKPGEKKLNPPESFSINHVSISVRLMGNFQTRKRRFLISAS